MDQHPAASTGPAEAITADDLAASLRATRNAAIGGGVAAGLAAAFLIMGLAVITTLFITGAVLILGSVALTVCATLQFSNAAAETRARQEDAAEHFGPAAGTVR